MEFDSQAREKLKIGVDKLKLSIGNANPHTYHFIFYETIKTKCLITFLY